MTTDARILSEEEFANALCMTIAMDCEAHRKIVANQRALTQRLAAVEALMEKWRMEGYSRPMGMAYLEYCARDLAKALGREA